MSQLSEKMIKYEAEMAVIFHYLLHGAYPPGCSETSKRNVRRQRDNFKIEGNLLYRKRVRQGDWVKVVTSAAEVMQLLKTQHQVVGAHCGVGNTKIRICEKYYWHGMAEDIKEYISRCPTCQVFKKTRTQAPVLKQIKVHKPLEIVGIDIIGGLPKTRSGNQYILNMIDYFTKHVWLFALPRKDGTGAHICIQQYTSILGAPKRMISDQGREFCNKINEDFCNTKGIKRCVTSAYHPQANGLVKRSNRTVRTMLSKLMIDCGPNWDETLHTINEAINSQQQASTKFTPFFLMFGRKPYTVTEMEEVDSDDEFLEESPEEFVEERQEIFGKVYEEAKINQENAHKKQKKDYAGLKLKGEKTFQIEEGQMVMQQKVQQQKGDDACEVYANANASALCAKPKPDNCSLDQNLLPQKLVGCKRKDILSLPCKVLRESKSIIHTKVEPVCCICRLPQEKLRPMLVCESCCQAFHMNCEGVSLGNDRRLQCSKCRAGGPVTVKSECVSD